MGFDDVVEGEDAINDGFEFPRLQTVIDIAFAPIALFGIGGNLEKRVSAYTQTLL